MNKIIAEYRINGELRAYTYNLEDLNDCNHFFDDEASLVRTFVFTDKGDSEEDYYREMPKEEVTNLVLAWLDKLMLAEKTHG